MVFNPAVGTISNVMDTAINFIAMYIVWEYDKQYNKLWEYNKQGTIIFYLLF